MGPEALCFRIVCLLVSVCMHEYTPAQTGIPDCRLLVCVCVFCATVIMVNEVFIITVILCDQVGARRRRGNMAAQFKHQKLESLTSLEKVK